MSGEEEDRLRERRAAVRDLGAALRELDEAAVSTEVDPAALHEIAAQARALAAPLSEASRSHREMPSVDGSGRRRRMYNPAVGPGNPVAPPMAVEIVDGAAIGTCTLGLRHEGPPGYAHGGVSAMLADQILGHAHAARKDPGMTVSLTLHYRRPVPLRTPLRLVGEVVDEPGQLRTRTRARITTAEAPELVLVRAEGEFVVPSVEQRRRIFASS